MRATLSVARCLASQVDPHIPVGWNFSSTRWQCIDCDQGARAKAGEENDDDVEALAREYDQAVGAGGQEGSWPEDVGPRKHPREVDVGMDRIPVQEPESQETIDRMIIELDRPVDTTETPLDQKQCPKCGQFKDREKDFNKDKNRADGKSRECRECLNRTARESRRAWREKLQRKLKDRPAAGQAGPAPEKVGVLVDEGPREPDDTEETGTMEKKPEISPDQKRCSKCGQVKDREKDFNKNKARADGKNWACRECANRIARERRRAWREKLQRKREAMAAHQPGQPQGVAPTEDSQRTLSLNFEKCPEILEMLTKTAEAELRTPEQQAIWILREILEKARQRLEA